MSAANYVYGAVKEGDAMKTISLVIFDVDGVLLDSLAPHLRICRDLNDEYSLGLSIPGMDEFRRMVAHGIKVSPMEDFFKAVGFTEDQAKKADEYYKVNFMKRYAPKPFVGVDQMLAKLGATGQTLGIVTSNVRANVDDALGSSMRHFNADCIFTKEGGQSPSKPEALKLCAEKLGVDPGRCLYVGDQPNDWKAARAAHVQFLGVTYGWGITGEATDFPTVNDVGELAEYLISSIQGHKP